MFRIHKRSYAVSLEKPEIVKETAAQVTYIKVFPDGTTQPCTERKHSSDIVWVHSYLEAVEIIKNHIQKEIQTAQLKLIKANNLLVAFNENFRENEFPSDQKKILISNR